MHYAGGVQSITGIILGVGSANERSCYLVAPSLIDWAHAQNDVCTVDEFVVSSTNKNNEDMCDDYILVVWGQCVGVYLSVE